MLRIEVLLATIMLSTAGAACSTATSQSAVSPPTAVRTKPRPTAVGPVLGTLTKPPAHRWDCRGRFARPGHGSRAPSIGNVSPEDTQMVATLMYQYYATSPLIDIRERDGLIDVTTGCCTNVSDDCSTFTVRFIKQSDREWNVVDTHELVP